MKKLLKSFFLLFTTMILAQTAPTIQWQKSLGGTNGGDHAYSVIQTADGGYIAAGSCSSNNGIVTGNHGSGDFWIVKLSSGGVLQWQKSLGGTGFEEAQSIIQTFDGGYIVVGFSNSNNGDVTGNHGVEDYWVVKLSSTGTIQWQKSLGGTGNEQAKSVVQSTDGGYVIVGYSKSNNGDITGNHGNSDFWIVKLSSLGVIEWQKAIGGSAFEEAHSIINTSDGGYMVAGFSTSNNGDITGNHGSGDYWVVKLTSSGAVQWQKALGGTNNDEAYSIIQTNDGGYVVAGTSSSNNGDVTVNQGGDDYWIVKLNSTGVIQWQKSLGGSNDDQAFSVVKTVDGGYFIAGSSDSNNGDVTGNHDGTDYWVVKINSTGSKQWQKSLGGSEWDYAYSAIQTADGGFVIGGYANSNDGDVTGNSGDDYWIVKLASEALEVSTFNQNSVKLYPNPTTNIFKIEGITVKNVLITDFMGKTVFNTTSSNSSVNISSLQNGIYFVRVESENGNSITHKIIKE